MVFNLNHQSQAVHRIQHFPNGASGNLGNPQYLRRHCFDGVGDVGFAVCGTHTFLS